MKKYKLLPEHEAQFKEHTQKWIDNGLSTKPMDSHDKEQMRSAIEGMYKAANLTPPPNHRIVFAPSPMCVRFAGGFAASIWYKRKKDAATRVATYVATEAATRVATEAATYDATRVATDAATDAATRAATDDATRVATEAATEAATYAATYDATYDATRAATRVATDAATDAATDDTTRVATYVATRAATYDATRVATNVATDAATYAATRAATDDATEAATEAATYAATYDATRDATRVATEAATYAATRAATDDATEAATDAAINKKWYSNTSGYIKAGITLKVGNFGFECAAKSWRMYQGGNFWSGWCAFLSFFKDVVKLDLDYSEYIHFENACKHGSYRIMHEKFCIISDRPTHIKLDDEGRPHCEDGSYIGWSDGSGFYAWHGTRVPKYWITNPEKLTAQEALTWDNVEERRAACEIIGWENILNLLDVKTLDKDTDPEIGELVEVDLPDVGKEKYLRVVCGTGRGFALPVPPEMKTALESQAWLNFCTTDDILGLEFRT